MSDFLCYLSLMGLFRLAQYSPGPSVFSQWMRSFFLTAAQCSIVHMCHNFVIHSSIHGHLGCFQILATMNSSAVSTEALIFFPTGGSGLLGIIPGRWITGSKGSSISNFRRKHNIDFHRGCSRSHSHQHCARVPCSPNPHQALLGCSVDGNYSGRCGAILRSCFSLHVSEDERCWAFLLVSLGQLYVLFGEGLVLVP